MKSANTSSNLNYFEVNQLLGITCETGSAEWYAAIKKNGYKYAYRWINSDENWMFFATNQSRAMQGAAELYAKEKGYDLVKATEYYGDTVDVYSIDQIIAEWF